MELLRSINGRVLVEGHRGAEGLAVENSWQAIEAGFAAGADLLELDIQRTADGELVIYHQYQLSDGRWIRDLDSKTLRKIQPKGHQLVFLEEVLEWVQNRPIGLALDIKNGFGFDSQIFIDTLASIERRDLIEKVMFIAWDHIGLKMAKNHTPEITTCALIRGRPVDIIQVAQNAKVDAVSLDADMVTSTEAKALHDTGIALVVSETVSPNFSRAVSLGADVICCKDPRAAHEALSGIL